MHEPSDDIFSVRFLGVCSFMKFDSNSFTERKAKYARIKTANGAKKFDDVLVSVVDFKLKIAMRNKKLPIDPFFN